MRTLVALWGVLAVIGTSIAFIPLLGWLNWLFIPFGIVGFILSAVTMMLSDSDENNNKPIAGMICCFFSVLLGLIRLFLGGGIL
ncbi:hypothetical protein GF373_14770 [bacterium]|nr:hypothetical protein [bacterium]